MKVRTRGILKDYAGLIHETLKSGNDKWRVRVEGDKNRRITLHARPEDPHFDEYYYAARAGIQLPPKKGMVKSRALTGSIGWLIDQYLAALTKRVQAGNASALTLRDQRSSLKFLRSRYADFTMDMPKASVVALRDEKQATPASADNLVNDIKAMYAWAIENEICDMNPAVGVGKLYRGGQGAIPWTPADLQTYRKHHAPGTQAHLCLTLFMFTACRISDAVLLGRGNEFERNGVRGLGWQPKKKGSAYVEIPMLEPLFQATRAAERQGDTYLLTTHGQPFKSPEGLRNRFKKWCETAGLKNRSSHGIRKGAGHLLAQHGCSQYEIMAIHGHTQAQTSEVYTKGVERWSMASKAMKKLNAIDW